MKTIVLDGKCMATKGEAHEYLSRVLELPDYYGRNLDALWDVLSTYDQPIRIIIKNASYVKAGENHYGNKILKVFEEAGEENEQISLAIED